MPPRPEARGVAEPPFRGEVQHLPARHPAEAGGAGERDDEGDADRRIRMGFGPRQDVERKGQQAVAHQDARGLVIGFVQGRPPAAQIVIVHGREVVMDQ